VVEASERLDLAPEQFQRIGGDVRPATDDLQRDGALGMLLLGLVDDAHSALTELADEAEVADEAVGAIAWRR